MAGNRSHSSIAKKLSDADKEALHKKLTTPGVTYDDIVAWLSAGGYAISRSAVGRYGKNFQSRLVRLKEVEQQAKAIVSEVGDALAMEEAAAKLFVQKVLEHLLTVDDLSGQKFGSLMQAFAKLQGSSTQRERLKAELQKKARATADAVKETAKKGGLSDEAIRLIEEQVLGIVR